MDFDSNLHWFQQTIILYVRKEEKINKTYFKFTNTNVLNFFIYEEPLRMTIGCGKKDNRSIAFSELFFIGENQRQ